MDNRSGEDYIYRFSTRRNGVLFLGSFLCVVGYGSGRLPLLFAGEFLLVLLAVEWVVGSGALNCLTVRRTHYPRGFEGQPMAVDLEIENPGGSRLFLFEAEDRFPPGSAFHVRNLAVTLPPRKGVRFRYRQIISRRRGLYVLGPVRLRSQDPLGLFTFQETADELTTLIIYPMAEPLAGFSVLDGGTHANIGAEVVRQIGRSEEFERLRAYRAGDSPRLIHWPSTARMRAPQVKEFERNVVTQVFIYCDMHLLALSGLGDLTTVEYRLRVAASVAAEAIRRGHLVKVVAVKEPREETRLAGGQSHLTALLDWMAVLKPEGKGCFEDDLLRDAEGMRRGATVVLVLSSIHVDLDRLRSAVRLLRMRRVHVIAVVVEDRSFLKLRREQEDLYLQAPPTEDLVGMLKDLEVRTYTVRNMEDVAQQLGVPV